MSKKKGLPAARSIHGPLLSEMTDAERDAHIEKFFRKMILRHWINRREVIDEDQLLLNLQEVSDE
tara:strand:+ start:312 stop:506 length:195 start_codon:yes stop_codon:yes gene_type:complete